jgi:Tfp pilus assembly protein PilF
MAATLLIAAALTAQPAISQDRVEVGYDELAKGQPGAAIARINGNTAIASNDPAALINLGTAYARLGNAAKAADYYRAAIVSPERYDLQLSDGSWMDSRRLARLALAKLAKGERLAAR